MAEACGAESSSWPFLKCSPILATGTIQFPGEQLSLEGRVNKVHLGHGRKISTTSRPINTKNKTMTKMN